MNLYKLFVCVHNINNNIGTAMSLQIKEDKSYGFGNNIT